MTNITKKPLFDSTRAYYSLLLFSFLLCILISVTIIGNRAESELKSYQTKATTQQAELYLNKISLIIETSIQLVADLSQTPSLANAAMGSGVSSVMLYDKLDDIVLLGKKEDIILVNIMGEVIYSNLAEGDYEPSFNPAISWLSEVLEEKLPYKVTTISNDDETRLRVIYPIKYNNLTEGALIVTFQLPLETLTPESYLTSEQRQGFILKSDDAYFSNLPEDESFISVYKESIKNSELTLEYFIDGDAISDEISFIQGNLALSIIVSLIISFALLSLIGRRYLLNPFKQLEELNERNQLFASVFDSSPVGISLADATKPDMPLTYVNDAFVNMTGYSKEESINSNCRFLQGENTSQESVDKIRHAIKTKTQVTVDLLNYTKQGEPFWNRLLVSPIFDSQGEVVYFAGIQQDITESVNQIKYIDGITKASQACLSYVDANGRYAFVNETYTEWYNKPTSYFIGKSFGEVLPKNVTKSFDENAKKAIKGEVTTYETIYPKPDGSERYVRGTLIPDIDELGTVLGYFVTVEDITGFKLTEQAHERAVEDAEQANKAKGEFLASMSHEIRTPLNGVMGMLDLLSSSELNDIQYKRTKLAKSSAESLLTLINDILDYSKIGAGKMAIEAIEFDVIRLISDYVETVAWLAALNQTEITLDVAGIDQSLIISDPGRLQQIITNVVGNAIKFTKNGKILIRASIVRSPEGLLLSCDIQDTGIGIPENKIPTLFDSFSQVDASTTRRFGGTGLGLTIVKQLCELMGGEISVTSELGEGSTFSFNIPVARENESISDLLDLSQSHILVVDDNDLNLDVLDKQLQRWGAQVVTTETSTEALMILEREAKSDQPIDLVLIDHLMPDTDGITLAEQIRSQDQFADLKLILMTTIDQDEAIRDYSRLGFSSYCIKPVTVNELAESISSAVMVQETRNEGQKTTQESDDKHEVDLSDYQHEPLILVEDNKVNQMVAIGILENLGFGNIALAENGQELISMLGDYLTTPIILMDCQMPVMDGYDATRAVRNGEAGEQHKDAAIIAMTANALHGDKEKCIDAGMNDYMSKPIRSEILIAKLKQILREKKAANPES